MSNSLLLSPSGTTPSVPPDKELIFRMLEKLQLSAGDLAEVFAEYVAKRPARTADLGALRAALKRGGTEEQMKLLALAGPVLSSDEMAKRLGLSSRQSVHNLKQKGKLLAVSYADRKGDLFPEFQLDGSAVREWIPAMLERIPDGWSALSFVVAGRKPFGGESHLQRIQRNASAVKEMLRCADAYAS